jgi:uncharacterized membrane protein
MTMLTPRVLEIATTTGAVGAGVVGGVLFGFSSFVMTALDRLPGDRAIEAMQSIDRHAPSPTFMTAMFGTAGVATLLGVDGVQRLDEPDGRLLTLGASAYLASLLVTVAYHVPRNVRLGRLATPAADAASIWRSHSRSWTRANHLRTALAIAAAALFTVAAGAHETT